MAKRSISVPVTMVGGVATVDETVLAAKLAEFAADPGNTRDLAQTEEYLNACVPIGSQKTKMEILMGIGRWTDDAETAKSVGDAVTELLTDSARFVGAKGRKGGYTRVS